MRSQGSQEEPEKQAAGREETHVEKDALRKECIFNIRLKEICSGGGKRTETRIKKLYAWRLEIS